MPRLSRPLRRLASLSPGELVDLLRAQAALVHAQWRAWFVPRGRLLRMTAAALPAPADRATIVEAERLARVTGWAASYGLFRPTCLVRALALEALLSARGVTGSVVRVGVRRAPAGLEAHAWLELAGRPIGERDEVVRTLAPLPPSTVVRSA